MHRSQAVFPMLNRAVETRLFPGCSIAVWHRGEVHLMAHGRLTYEEGSHQVTPDTYYDLASLTKPLVTGLITLHLCSEGLLSLEMPMSRLLGKDAGSLAEIPLKHLLSHSSGLAAHLNLYELLKDIGPGERKAACLKLISSLALEAPVPTYSDLGFILLGILLEKLTQTPLHVLFEQRILPGLQTEQLFFLPIHEDSMESSRLKEAFAPTGYCPVRKTMVAGQVNDLNAWWLQGVAGHAGLFGNASALLQALVRLLEIHNGRIRSRLIPGNWLQTFFTPVAGPHTRALAFDTPSLSSSSGRYFSNHTVGHLGWTGCSFWMDLKQEVIMIFLCNRPFPRADNTQNMNEMRRFRPAIHNLLWETLIK